MKRSVVTEYAVYLTVNALIAAVVSSVLTGALLRSDLQFDVGSFAGTILGGLGVAFLTYWFTARHYLSVRRREQWTKRHIDSGIDRIARNVAIDVETQLSNLLILENIVAATRVGRSVLRRGRISTRRRVPTIS